MEGHVRKVSMEKEGFGANAPAREFVSTTTGSRGTTPEGAGTKGTDRKKVDRQRREKSGPSISVTFLT